MIVMNGWERADIPEASIVHNESFCGRVIVAIAEFLPQICEGERGIGVGFAFFEGF